MVSGGIINIRHSMRIGSGIQVIDSSGAIDTTVKYMVMTLIKSIKIHRSINFICRYNYMFWTMDHHRM
jgi:hypothetical protein